MDPPPSRRLDDVDPLFGGFQQTCEIHSTWVPHMSLQFFDPTESIRSIRYGLDSAFRVAGARRDAADIAPVHRDCWPSRRASGVVVVAGSSLSRGRQAGAIRLRRPHGVVAADRHHSPRGIRSRRRESPARSRPWSAESASSHWAPRVGRSTNPACSRPSGSTSPGLIPNP